MCFDWLIIDGSGGAVAQPWQQTPEGMSFGRSHVEIAALGSHFTFIWD